MYKLGKTHDENEHFYYYGWVYVLTLQCTIKHTWWKNINFRLLHFHWNAPKTKKIKYMNLQEEFHVNQYIVTWCPSIRVLYSVWQMKWSFIYMINKILCLFRHNVCENYEYMHAYKTHVPVVYYPTKYVSFPVNQCSWFSLIVEWFKCF